MKTTDPDVAYFGLFQQAFRERVHQLIAWGYEDVRHRIKSDDEQEPAITGYIVKAIRNRLRALDCPRWCAQFSIHDDPPVEKEGSSGRARPRADIIIEANFQGRPEYVFEAKRLRKYGYGAGKYVSEEGMGCFISGLYARRYDEAAMLGYVQSDSLTYWQNEIKAKINQERSELHLRSPQCDVRIINALSQEWISEHERISVGRPIAIYHILLDCCS
jgi:hypothetical protein